MKGALIALLVLAAPPVAAREPLGTFGRWGAFRDTGPRHCFAISEPVRGAGRNSGFVSVARWPGAGILAQFHARLSRPRDPRAAVILAIGERRFRLTAGPADAWAPDTATDRAIVAALRSGRSLSVESFAAGGGPFADTYALHGAATAIDTALLACAR